MNIRYILTIVHIDGVNFDYLYDIPLDHICNLDDAIEQAHKLNKCLKDNYVVCINKTERYHVGYVTELKGE